MQKGVTGASLAELIGVTREAVWAWESGKNKIPKMAEIAIQTVLKVGPMNPRRGGIKRRSDGN